MSVDWPGPGRAATRARTIEAPVASRSGNRPGRRDAVEPGRERNKGHLLLAGKTPTRGSTGPPTAVRRGLWRHLRPRSSVRVGVVGSKRRCWLSPRGSEALQAEGALAKRLSRRASPCTTFAVTVSLELEHCDAASLDRRISGAVAEVGRTLWKEVLERLRQVVEAQPRPACPRMRGLPEIEWAPSASSGAADVGGRGQLRAGALALHQLRPGTGSPSIRPWACRLDPGTPSMSRSAAFGWRARCPTPKASQTAGELRRWQVSHGQIHAWAQAVGQDLEGKIAAEQPEMFERGVFKEVEHPPATIWVSIDGTPGPRSRSPADGGQGGHGLEPAGDHLQGSHSDRGPQPVRRGRELGSLSPSAW